MGSEFPLGHQRKPQGFSVSLTVTTVEDADSCFCGILGPWHSVNAHLYERTIFAFRDFASPLRSGNCFIVEHPHEKSLTI